MRWFFIIAMMLAAGAAAAQPVSFQLKGDVPQGQKPQIRITAVTKVTDVRIELDRDDGKHFTHKHGSLAKGGVVTLSIGDGAAGKASYKGTISARIVGGDRWSDALIFDTLVRAPLKVSYDAAHLDLDKRVLQFKLSRPAGKASLVVIGDDGKELGRGAATYNKEPANTWLSVTWTQPPGTRVMMLKLEATSADGITSNVELIPWSVTVDHEDVNFATDSAVIEASEAPKLDASLAKIDEVVKRSQKFVKMRLYIAGHTDTVGNNAKNRKLSLDRARSIAAYFRKQGLALPIAFEGFGEEVLKVKTPDNTDERANRRVDYVIGPLGGTPPFGGAYLKAKAAWKELR
ncbi:MAG TPA: OmpA family protein [Kofleriaceae bacterium]|jgi:outer membrane protein OmpA-like peptidoglycan-associated protein|nr:OmpA family protein [Kofleriaceae bacterium]